jgi:heat shock protein HslJ
MCLPSDLPAPSHRGKHVHMFRFFLSLPILLAACLKDETISGYVDQTATFQLVEINGAKFTATATLSFPEQGRISGQAPCNSYNATQTAPYPWFELGPIRATLSTCPEMAEENEFFETLTRMTLIETLADVVILRNDEAEEMLFRVP